MKNWNVGFSRSGLAGAFCRGLAVLALGWSVQTGLGQTNLVKNGDFSDGLTDWKTVGDVTADSFHAVLTDSGADPILYQAVTGGSYAYELRFDIDLGGVSDRPGSGSFDEIKFIVYEGDSAATLTPETAAKSQILMQGNASGLTALVPNAQIVPNPVLGIGYASAVVEIFSNYPAIAGAVTIVNQNGLVDSEVRVTNVRLYAVDRGRLSNISNRGPVGTGPNRMIVGFVVSGADKKSAVVRGAGPWLGALGVPNSLEDPAMQLKTLGGTILATNDDWETGNNKTELIDAMTKVGAWQIPFADGSKDSAIFYNEAGGLGNGQYSVVVSGNNLVGDQSQIAIAEVYDYDVFGDGATELVNISNRGKTSQGAGAQIPGFVIAGNRGRIVLIRVVGPSLASFVTGTLDDPKLTLLQGNDVVETNDDYGDAINTDQILATSERVGAFALLPGAKDSAILMALQPGVYTAKAQVQSAGDSGVVLVEVYMVSNTRPNAGLHPVFVSTQGSTTLPMEEILSPIQDAEGDILAIASFGQPANGEITQNLDGELVFTNDLGFVGQTIFNYTLSDGEFESAPGTIGLNVAPPGSKVWLGGSSGNFSDPANWAGGAAPGATDDVWIVPLGDTSITLDQDTSLKSLRIGGIGSQVAFTMQYGRTLTTSGKIDVARSSTFDLQSGTVSTGDNFTIAGTFKQTSNGTMKGNGTTIIDVGGVAELSNGQLALDGGRDFINRGKVNQSNNSYIYATNGNSDVTNAAGANWDVNHSNGRFAYQDSSSTLTFTNAGNLYKTGTSGTAIFGWSSGTSNFANQATGRVVVEGGILEFQGSGTGTHSGELMIATGGEAKFTYGTHTFGSGAVISDVGTMTVSTNSSVTIGTANVLESLKLESNGILHHSGTLTVTDFSQESSSTLDSDDDLVVTNSFQWTGGTQKGSGVSVIEAAATGMASSGQLQLQEGRGLINKGTFTQTGSAYFYSTGGSVSTLDNASDATWTLGSGNGTRFAWQDGSSTINLVNSGTLEKTGTNSLVYFGYPNGTSNFTNTGTVSILGGTLQFDGSGSGTHDGDLSIASGATALFYHGSHSFGSEAVVSETGTLEVNSNAVVNLPAAFTIESIAVRNGTLNAAGAVTVASFVQSAGTFASAADLTITDSLEWTGGKQSGNATTIIGAEATGTFSAGQLQLQNGRDLTNLGEVTQSGSSYFYSIGGSVSVVTNTADATWNLNASNGTRVFYQDNSSTMNLVNAGTMTKSNINSLVYVGYSSGTSNFTNSGTFRIEGGTVLFDTSGSGTHSGALSIASGATAQFYRGTHTFQSGATITDTGTVEVTSSATVSLPGAMSFEGLTITNGTLVMNGAVTVGAFQQTNGTLSGSADLTVTDSFSWTAGTQTGSGTTIIGSEATATTTSSQCRLEGGRDFTNNGVFTQSGNGYFYAAGGSNSTITNSNGATWNLTVANNTTYAYTDNSSTLNFVNAGTLAKTNASGTVYFGTSAGSVNFSSTGSITVSGGTLEMRGSGTGSFGGSVSIAAGGYLTFYAGTHTFPIGATITGAGTLRVENGSTTVTLTDGYTLPNVEISNGRLRALGTMSVGSFNQTNGTYDSNANLTVTTAFIFNGGNATHTGSGVTIIGSEATATFASGNFYLSGNHDFTNNGTMTQSGSARFQSIDGSNSEIVNSGSATWTLSVSANTTMAFTDSSSLLTFTNNGDLIKTSASRVYFGTTSGSTILNNNGNLDVSSGWMHFQGASSATLSNTSVLTISISTTQVGIAGDVEPINFGGSLVLKANVTPPTGQAIRIIDYDLRNGSVFNSITAPQGLTIQTTNYTDAANNGHLDVTF